MSRIQSCIQLANFFFREGAKMTVKPFPHKDDLGYKWAIIITPTLGWDPSKHPPPPKLALYHCPLSSQAATFSHKTRQDEKKSRRKKSSRVKTRKREKADKTSRNLMKLSRIIFYVRYFLRITLMRYLVTC